MAPDKKLNNDPFTPLLGLYRASDLFREHDPMASVILMQAFVLIASNPDNTLSGKELADRLNIKEASMSHNIARLGGRPGRSDKPRNGGEPLGFVSVDIDPRDARRKTLKLTAMGRTLASQMGLAIGGRI